MFKKVYVEITNNCNLNCDFCIHNKRENKFISLDEYKLILNKLKGYTNYLYLHVLGEPLLHPNINEIIDLGSKNFNINITTNGYLIELIKENKNIRQINISLHSFIGKNIDQYLGNIFDSVDTLSKNTYISYRLWANTPWIKEIISKLEEKYNKKISINEHIELSKNVYLDFNKEFNWPDLNNKIYNETGTCYALRNHIGILVDGTVIPCCLDGNGIIKMGNIYEDDIETIINSKLFNDMKNGFKNNKKICELCKHCDFIN